MMSSMLHKSRMFYNANVNTQIFEGAVNGMLDSLRAVRSTVPLPAWMLIFSFAQLGLVAAQSGYHITKDIPDGVSKLCSDSAAKQFFDSTFSISECSEGIAMLGNIFNSTTDSQLVVTVAKEAWKKKEDDVLDQLTKCATIDKVGEKLTNILNTSNSTALSNTPSTTCSLTSDAWLHYKVEGLVTNLSPSQCQSMQEDFGEVVDQCKSLKGVAKEAAIDVVIGLGVVLGVIVCAAAVYGMYLCANRVKKMCVERKGNEVRAEHGDYIKNITRDFELSEFDNNGSFAPAPSRK